MPLKLKIITSELLKYFATNPDKVRGEFVVMVTP